MRGEEGGVHDMQRGVRSKRVAEAVKKRDETVWIESDGEGEGTKMKGEKD